ncbi:MAG TPA: hypothetical protein VF188_00190 [Longimicrobiales bacterium]
MSLPPAGIIGAALAAALSLSACQTIDAAPRCEPSVPAAVAALQEDLPGLALAGALGPDDARRFVDEVARYNGTPPAPVDGAVLLVHPPSRTAIVLLTNGGCVERAVIFASDRVGAPT